MPSPAPAHSGGYLAYVFPVTLLIGTGAGLCFPALMTLAMSSATAQDAGLASGLVVVAIAAAAALLRPQRAAAADPQTALELVPAIQAG